MRGQADEYVLGSGRVAREPGESRMAKGCHPVKQGGVHMSRAVRSVLELEGPVDLNSPHPPTPQASPAPSTYSPGRFTTIASCVLRAITTTASSAGSGFSSRCGTNGGTKM